MSGWDEYFKNKKQIKDMKEGETGFALPWSIWKDEENVLWIRGGHSVESDSYGNHKAMIKMTSSGVVEVIELSLWGSFISQYINPPWKETSLRVRLI